MAPLPNRRSPCPVSRGAGVGGGGDRWARFFRHGDLAPAAQSAKPTVTHPRSDTEGSSAAREASSRQPPLRMPMLSDQSAAHGYRFVRCPSVRCRGCQGCDAV
ncbi:hypothetical protein AAFF_G00048720 [Aldrovandia affinis]|uniref:Uncharacterized protein n=1 Tax=Aldrovandia affinis TaxID=143900 RepID=A0AAD7WFQ5_9TELE|nr:hypothetical protein AAFF_G00048720 [Aldrovandia affinis]